jgi:tetratricopeptide (TPR) repeat protein
MAPSIRLPTWLLPLLFLGLILWVALRLDPDFWRSNDVLMRLAQEAETRKDFPRAIELAHKVRSWDPKDPGNGVYLGWLYLKADQPEPALLVFREVWAQDRQAVGALTGQARALELLGKRQEARQLLADYLQGQPLDAEVLRTAGELAARRLEDRPLAITYYRQLYQLRPDGTVRRQLLDLLTAQGQFAEAIPLQEEEAAEHPEDQEALHRLALLHYWHRDYQAAGQVYQRLLEQAAEDETLRREAARAADAAHDLDQALSHYLWLFGRHGGKKEYAMVLARLWSQKGNHAEAAAVLAPLMQDKPDHEVQRWYALELLLIRDFAKAQKAYEAAWEAGDTHRETIINLARLHARGRRFHQAAHFWDEACRRQLAEGELCWEAALTYSYARRYRDAAAVLEPLHRQDPKNPKLLLFLGQIHFYQRDWTQAAHYWETYLEGHPNDVEVRRQLAEVLSFRPHGREEALRQYGEALQRRDDPVLRLRRVTLLLESRQWEEGERELRQCPIPDNPALLREQARLCLWVGDLEGALSRYDRFLKKEPRDRDARMEKARVLIYLRRGPEALKIIRDLRGSQTGARLDQPGDGALLTASIEATLANQDWAEAGRWALKLYCRQFPRKHRLARDWAEAREWGKETADAGSQRLGATNYPSPKLPAPEETVEARLAVPATAAGNEEEPPPGVVDQPLPSAQAARSPSLQAKKALSSLKTENRKQKTENPQPLTLEERTWVARALCHSKDPQDYLLAADLAVENLHQKRSRSHHPSLLILEYLLPRLPRYEDLDRLADRLPGIGAGSPGHTTGLAYFDAQLGRHGGKVNYLLHLLESYRHRQWPQSPGELLALADLAMELGESGKAVQYLRRAQKLKPRDRVIAGLIRQCQLSRKNWSAALESLRREGSTPENALEMARLYFLRGQYEGVKAMTAQIPADSPARPQALLLQAQACRADRSYPEALKTLAELGGLLPEADLLMEKAQVLEAQGDKGAVGLYEEIVRREPHSQAARVAKARQARARGDWAWAYRAYAQALKEAPQDIELLNELEFVRSQMRPILAARGFGDSRGERRPEESARPWQFSRFDREPQGLGLSNFVPGLLWDVLPVVQPESTFFTDSNKLYGGIFRIGGGFWITKVLPVTLGVEYREYNQTQKVRWYLPGTNQVAPNTLVENGSDTASRLRRGEVSLGLGPLSVGDRLRLSAELIGRRYWKRVDFSAFEVFGSAVNPAFIQNSTRSESTVKGDQDRLMGSLELTARLRDRTEATLRYSRRDIFDQEPYLYPRLYQSVLDLANAQLTSLHQVDLGYSHQFRPGLDWRGNFGGAFYSDQNRRFTLYQGLAWEAVGRPRMHLDLTPHFYYANYRDRHEAYFSPHSYSALGLGIDFDRQIFRLPKLILQGTVQGVNQHGEWGPALQGLAALEIEFVHNFYTDLFIFYFREWVDDYRLTTAGVSFRWRF